ncbi:hypothetical protein D1818_24265 [Aquimarina sp. BL5]|uniref:hypothetical protein n=1 Tax=Aquimarina sp. BL5 TaxID=1714860 RepID=UPI000E51964B|nr:hypothetical protein [Aquimarina sp. BL5]AXT53782.1 hypothetical protein D1818_24265 [Aquimarina sp. BL5]RKN00530.1 hypothetical protein D7036_18480 [Aquimarina sp. BL5]
MTKQLHPTLLLVFLLVSPLLIAQKEDVKEAKVLFDNQVTILEISTNFEMDGFNRKNVFSYISNFELDSHDSHNHSEHTLEQICHMHSESISLIDIISSDEGSDFNCSGGFCMDKSHFHKRGLTLKKQLFDYFMKISC